MGRKTIKNNITDEHKIAKINKKNSTLKQDYIDYLISIDRAETTIRSYDNDLDIFFCWNLDSNENKSFVEITKREFARFQSYALNTWEWSPNRIRRVKATLSSLSNYIENILDEEPEFKGYRNIVSKIESPAKIDIREKTILEDEQIELLLRELTKKKQYDKACMLSLAANSGRRKAELPQFKTSYLTEENIVFGSFYKTPEKIKTKGRGKRGKMLHAYVLMKDFQPYLDKWLEYRKENEINSEWLFPNKQNFNEPMKITTLDSWADTFSRILDVPFYWHSLRHYFTTSLAKCNLPDGVIQSIIGWDSLEMVKVYKDIDADDEIGKYFNEDGIKDIKQTTLSDL